LTREKPINSIKRNDAGAHKVVMAALVADGVVAAAKLTAALFSGSAAMLSEALHSLADASNQMLLLVGRRLSRKPADAAHSFGYGKERFFWPFVVSIVSFSVGGIFAIMNGVRQIQSPHVLEYIPLNYVILVLALAMDGFSLFVAWRELRRAGVSRVGRRTIAELLKESKSPAVVVAFLLDIGAVIGVGIAVTGLWLSAHTRLWMIDGMASVLIGVLLFCVSWAIAVEAKSLLIGESASAERVKEIREMLISAKGVERVSEILTMHLSPDDILVNIDVEFSDGLSTGQIENAIAEMERDIRKVIPEASKIFIEAKAVVKAVRRLRV